MCVVSLPQPPALVGITKGTTGMVESDRTTLYSLSLCTFRVFLCLSFRALLLCTIKHLLLLLLLKCLTDVGHDKASNVLKCTILWVIRLFQVISLRRKCLNLHSCNIANEDFFVHVLFMLIMNLSIAHWPCQLAALRLPFAFFDGPVSPTWEVSSSWTTSGSAFCLTG
jgi:hypothetical protein